MKDSLLFEESFIGSVGSMVSETAIGAVDLTQIIGIASIDGVNRLVGGQTTEWMKRTFKERMTPSRNIRNNVNKDIQLPMPNPAIPGRIIEIGERLEADHIV